MITTTIDQIIQNGPNPRVILKFPNGKFGDFRLRNAPFPFESKDQITIDEKELEGKEITVANFCGSLTICGYLMNIRL